MKINNLVTASIVGIALFTTGASFTSANASTWHKGVPSAITNDEKHTWLSNKKIKGKNNLYYRTNISFNYGTVASDASVFKNNGKGYKTLHSAYPILGVPYYKKTGKSTYQLKATHTQSTSDAKDMMKVTKSGKHLKIWLKNTKQWKFLGTFKLVKDEFTYKVDPFK